MKTYQVQYRDYNNEWKAVKDLDNRFPLELLSLSAAQWVADKSGYISWKIVDSTGKTVESNLVII